MLSITAKYLIPSSVITYMCQTHVQKGVFINLDINSACVSRKKHSYYYDAMKITTRYGKNDRVGKFRWL